MPIKDSITIKSRIDEFIVDILIPDNWNEEKLIICCHGFNSGKNSESYVSIGDALLKNGIACAKFSLPYHAERRTDHNDLTVNNCVEDSELAEKAIREKYPNTKIGIIATSFGGYLTLLRLRRYHNNYFAIILKSPAIKMGEILRHSLTDVEFQYFKKMGFGYDKNKDKPMRINYSFYEELEQNRVMDDYVFDEKILIIHGKADSLAPFEDSQEFVEKNRNASLIMLEGEDHKLSEEGLTKFCSLAVAYLLVA